MDPELKYCAVLKTYELKKPLGYSVLTSLKVGHFAVLVFKFNLD